MPARSLDRQSYLHSFVSMLWLTMRALTTPPTHSRRAEAGRRWARHSLWLMAIVALAVVGLMYVIDVPEIRLMPTRGMPSLWPIRILTDFGKSTYVIWAIVLAVIAVALTLPAVASRYQAKLANLGARLTYLLTAVSLSALVGEVIKWTVGRGRPFVGGEANAFNFSHFAGSEAYASFPSGHAVTASALAFAVSAVWPRATPVMIVYALAIVASRLVLLAHHPSDVVAGAFVGVAGAMFARYWFAARHLVFTIGSDGTITPLPSVGLRHFRVARTASAS